MNNRIRINQIVYRLDIEGGGGGITRFAIELSKALDPESFQVTFTSLWGLRTPAEQERIDDLKEYGVKVFIAAPWREGRIYSSFIRALGSFRRYLTQQPVDILHSHSEFTDILAVLLKNRNTAPNIIRTVQYGYKEEWRHNPFRRLILTNFLFPIRFDAEVGVNQQITQRLTHRWLATQFHKKATCIYNAIPLNRSINATQSSHKTLEDLNLPEKALIVGTVGRLTEQKGYSFLLQAAAKVIKELPESYFIFVGGGELANEMLEQAQNLKIDRNVIFTGSRTDIENLYKAFDLFVSSSLWEGLPNVILESMIFSVPVLGTDIPGTREVIEHGKNGWLVLPANPEAMSDAILYLLKRPDLRQKLSAQALGTLHSFSTEAVSRQYESLYRTLTIP